MRLRVEASHAAESLAKPRDAPGSLPPVVQWPTSVLGEELRDPYAVWLQSRQRWALLGIDE